MASAAEWCQIEKERRELKLSLAAKEREVGELKELLALEQEAVGAKERHVIELKAEHKRSNKDLGSAMDQIQDLEQRVEGLKELLALEQEAVGAKERHVIELKDYAESLREGVQDLEQRVEVLRAALEFYARPVTYAPHLPQSPIDKDHGAKARRALSPKPSGPGDGGKDG